MHAALDVHKRAFDHSACMEDIGSIYNIVDTKGTKLAAICTLHGEVYGGLLAINILPFGRAEAYQGLHRLTTTVFSVRKGVKEFRGTRIFICLNHNANDSAAMGNGKEHF